MKLCEEQIVKTAEESTKERVVELCERSGDRKYMKASADQMATTLLGERKAYVLTEVRKGEDQEEYTENIVIDGACMRTPEEDLTWADEQAEMEAQAAKGGKGKPPAKKKWSEKEKEKHQHHI